MQHRSHQGKHPRLLWLQLLSPCALEAALQNQRSALAAARESPLQQRRPNTAKDKSTNKKKNEKGKKLIE